MIPRAAGAGGDAGADGAMDRRSSRRVLDRIRAGIDRSFAVDPRGLAALRIAVGLLLLADLAIRGADLIAFYTDVGVLPRPVLVAEFGDLARLAFLHGLSGSVWVQALLFGLAGTAALALVLGYRSRLAAALSLLFLISLHARNPVLLNAGDSLLRRLLLWGLFLPLASRWSIGAGRGRRRDVPVANVATAALLLQVVIVYAVNGIIKLRGESWVSGEAIRLVFELDHLTVGLGNTLAQFPLLLESLGLLWLLLLLGSPLLVLLRGWPRAALVGLYAAMHLGMLLTMRLGLFPLISVAALLPFLPPSAWDSVSRQVGQRVQRGVDMAAWRVPLERVLPAGSIAPIGTDYRRVVRQAMHVVVALLVSLVLVWNAASLGYVDMPRSVTAVADPSERRWDMFGPDPRRNDGWFVVPGELESGGTVDAFGRKPVAFDRPEELASTFPSHRWFVYLLELPRPGSHRLRAAFADYLCRRWNADHADDLESVTVIYMLERARLGGPDPVERVNLGRYDCPPA